jgi:hypothetical protein
MSVKDPRDGTPIDEAIRRMESGPFSQSVCDGLRAAAEAFGGDDEPEDVTPEIRDTLAWMVADMNHRREQTGLDGDVKSPEMQVAERLLADLQGDRIECRRVI